MIFLLLRPLKLFCNLLKILLKEEKKEKEWETEGFKYTFTIDP